jgi:hypothetical protein
MWVKARRPIVAPMTAESQLGADHREPREWLLSPEGDSLIGTVSSGLGRGRQNASKNARMTPELGLNCQ